MVPPFGFSVGDFINAIGLINKVRQALKDVGGAEDDIQLVTNDLQHLELILIQLKNGDWGAGGDISHVNAIRGIAPSCVSALEDFLRKVEDFQRSASCEPGSSTKTLTRGFKKVQWAISMKEEVNQLRVFLLSNLMTLNLLLAMPLDTALEKLEDNTLMVTDLLRQKTKAIMFDQENSQLTIQMAKENLNDMKNQSPRTDSTVTSSEDLNHQSADLSNDSIKTKLATGEALIDMESIQRQTPALFPTGTKLSVVVFITTAPKLNITGMTTEELSLLRKLLQTNLRICFGIAKLQDVHFWRLLARSTRDPFVFIDRFGRKPRLEYHWFQHWEVFAAMLKGVLKAMPNEDYVTLNCYLFYKAHSGYRRLHETVWGKDAVFPVSRIKVSINITKRPVTSARCPNCNCTAKCENLEFFHW